MNKIITREHKEVSAFFRELEEMYQLLSRLIKEHRPFLNGERYMTDTELASHLKLTKRTLQDYRNTGKIPFYQIGGRILYKESDIIRLLEDNRKEAFR